MATPDAAGRDAGQILDMTIHGMSCAACVGRVERVLLSVPGVLEANANLATGRATVRALDNDEIASLIIAALDDAGYPAALETDDRDRADRDQTRRSAEIANLKKRFTIAAVATAPLLMLEMGTHLSDRLHAVLMTALGQTNMRFVAFLLATVVLFGPGIGFFRKGFPALWRGAPDMNSLVAVGTIAAYGFSVLVTFWPALLPDGSDVTYFESGAVVVMLVLLGRWLEARAKGRTGDAIRKLLTLEAKSARILRDGEIVEVAIDAVRVGDLVVVRPGERVPVDGQVTDGASYIDESMITGEPIPVSKSAGSSVVGGTINKNGSLTFRSTKIGADTLLAQIVRTVEAAQGSKLPIQAMVDRVTNWFVPAVMGLAALTFLAWLIVGPSPALSHALINAVAVLIIACPCAMGLATPTSIMVGTGKAAEMGVLFRRGDALESLSKATVIAFDKTGTLTEGRPELTDIEVTLGFAEADVLALVAAVEIRSEHPTATAIVASTKRRNISIPDVAEFAAEPGLGVRGTVGGRKVSVGSDRLMRDIGLDPQPFAATAQRLADDGKSPVYAAIDGHLAAIIAVADPIKDTTPAAIAALRQLGRRVVMITGDNRRTAEAIARLLNIDEVMAEVLPTGKADCIKQLQEKAPGCVAFIGDGINDAPALAQADVGLAVGNGTDIAIESADAVLMSGNLRNVANAIALSEATVANIRQNLFLSFAYNVVLIPVAAGALYPLYGITLSPMLAGLAMATSSVSVVTNALRLRRFTAPFATHDAAISPVLSAQAVAAE